MKKIKVLLAMVALVAVVAVATVAQAATFNVGATVSSTVAITECADVALTLTPTTKDSDVCQTTVASNDTDGYKITLGNSSATDNDLDSVSTSDNVIALITTATACSTGADCYSWYLSDISGDAGATAGTDSNNGSADFDTTEHTLELSAAAEDIYSSTAQYSGTFDTTWYGTTDATTEDAADYTTEATIVITGL